MCCIWTTSYLNVNICNTDDEACSISHSQVPLSNGPVQHDIDYTNPATKLKYTAEGLFSVSSSEFAQAGQVASVTWPVIGWA